MFSRSFSKWLLLNRGVDGSRSDQSSPSSPSCSSSSSLCSHRVAMVTTLAHTLPLLLPKPRPHKPCASPSPQFIFSALMFVYFVCIVGVGCLCMHMLTIWVAKFLQCTAHGRFDSQVPPFRAYSGGPGQTDKTAVKSSVFFHTLPFWITLYYT